MGPCAQISCLARQSSSCREDARSLEPWRLVGIIIMHVNPRAIVNFAYFGIEFCLSR